MNCPRKANVEATNKLCTLEVYLTSGPTTEAHVAKNPVVCRTIQVRGDQTLYDLHKTIFQAFNRWEKHSYQFQVGGRGPFAPRCRRFEHLEKEGPVEGYKPSKSAQATRLDDLKLKVGQPFGYWFDFGDDWRHQINVEAIGEPAPRARYPKVVKRVGASPPPYAEWDEDGE
jgi:hypothetical protein